ncbi:hypothetical protein BT96DRAFT_1002997 [Gymnopus androsaceus JB14]|uniref:Eukaryotic translation initiation factor 3 subunit E N-terminal domain-containing protein n=1 Tax=Gymnopus androsaceus JB14 TaxID=1447944 RepID=A0A6A4GW97_9AGAR|nr:hypothetical protein BT96DRAFT_1002997 [Gymnopus androsaceus JB14]
MFDYAATLFEQIYPNQEVPKEFDEKRENAVSTNERLQQEAQAVLDYLKDNYNLTLDQITALYNFGKFQYSYGNYSGAADYLYHFRVLSTDPDLTISAHWGKLASDILTGKWDVALEELNSLREAIDSRSPAPFTVGSTNMPAVDPALTQLHSRTWLVHWSLFVYFNHPQGGLVTRDVLIPNVPNTIQTSCPWILRYVAAAARHHIGDYWDRNSESSGPVEAQIPGQIAHPAHQRPATVISPPRPHPPLAFLAPLLLPQAAPPLPRAGLRVLEGFLHERVEFRLISVLA